MNTIDQLYKGLTPRLFVFGLVLCFIPLLLLVRLWYEQVHRGAEHQKSISRQSIRTIRLTPVRGRIFSRDGMALTDNVPEYDAYFHIHEMRQPGRFGYTQTIKYVLSQLDLVAAAIERQNTIGEDDLKRHIRLYPALPFKAFTSLNDQERARLIEMIHTVPGLEIINHFKRVYPLGEATSHILGFVGRKDPSDESDRDLYSYFLPELSGRNGLEKLFDDELDGHGGSQLVQVDSMGFFFDDYESEPAIAGNDVQLTLDSRAQQIAYRLLVKRRGAIVLVDTLTGAVLALCSSPAYDPNKLTKEYYDRLRTDRTGRPLINRALNGGYSPGSIIKPLVGMLMLESGFINGNDKYDCNGAYAIGDTRIRCATRYGHGEITMIQALESSCNPFFIHGGVNLGLEKLQTIFSQAGFGTDLEFIIKQSSSSGTFPTRARKYQTTHQPWNIFDTALISIGQGQICISPLHAAMFTAAIANGGTLFHPYLVQKLQNHTRHTIKYYQPEIIDHLAISPANMEIIRAGMYAVIHGPNASASEAQTSVIELAGKTGTAEVGRGKYKKNNTWFVCYGPYQSPQYALAVLVEDGVSGGKTAAPLARRFFELYLKDGERLSNSQASVRNLSSNQIDQ